MAKFSERNRAPKVKEPVMTTSDLPIGGHPQNMPTERPEADVIMWSDTGTEVQQDLNGNVVGAPAARERDEAREEKIRQALHGDKATEPKDEPSDANPVEAKADDANPADGKETAKPVDKEPKADAKATEPVAKPARRDMLDSLRHEREKRKLETDLHDAQDKLAAAEARASAGESALTESQAQNLYKMARKRGLTREQALDEIINAQEEDAAAAGTPVAAAKPSEPNAEIEELKRTVAELTADRRAATEADAFKVVQAHLAPLDVPTLKAARTVAMPMMQADGGTGIVQMSREQAVLSLAQARWIADGRPQNTPRTAYLAESAQVLEEAIASGEIAAAMDRKKPAVPLRAVAPDDDATEEAPAAAVPSVGKRMGGGVVTPKSAIPIELDREERHRMVKERMGLR